MSPSRRGPRPTGRKEGAPNVLFIVLDDTGFGQLGCYGSPISDAEPRRAGRRRAALQQHAHDGALFAVALVHDHRAQPSLQRHVLHHRGLDGLSRRQRHHSVRERHAVGNPAAERLQHLRARQVAPDAGRSRPRRPGPTTAGRSAAASSATTASSAATRTSTIRSSCATTRQTEPEKTPEEGYHLTPDLVEKAKAMIADAKQVAPNKPFFMYFCTGAMHAPHHVPKEWADKYKGKFDDGWDAYREKVFAKQKELGIIPKNTKLSRHDPDVQDWRQAAGRRAPLYARMMEVFAGFLEHTDHYIGELIAFLKDIGEYENTLIMVISDNGASAEGGPTRLGQRGQVLQQRARRPGAEPRRHRRHRRAEILQPLSVGLDPRRQHAVPALEARDLSRRRRPIRSSSAGPRASRPGARSARSTATPSTWCRPCSMRSASSRRRRSAASRSRRSRASA